MNNTLKIAAISAIVVLALGGIGAGVVLAQAPTPQPGYGWGRPGGYGGGMMGGWGYQNGTPAPGYGWGMTLAPGLRSGASAGVGGWAQTDDGYQWMNNMHAWMSTTGGMHNLVWDGLADALGLTQDELNARLSSGQTLAQIAEAQGVTQEELAAALEASVKAGLDQAVADGVLTREQADWMLSHTPALASGASVGDNWDWMISHMGAGFGPGGCHGFQNQGTGVNFVPQR